MLGRCVSLITRCHLNGPLINTQVQDAVDHLPALVILEDLDALCPKSDVSSAAEGGPTGDPGLLAWLCDVMDHFAQPVDIRPVTGGAPFHASHVHSQQFLG